ncbi:IpaD/SipD/SspD family type III secretion system needle tip protein [Pandoraea commovens]|uniref:Translocator protein BipD n=1 Tax=Pandoraea commovens TaxID=2508289 RepID=A0A5E4U182_9BURK|nr:IpaD/SipD/SspD family type III secretion system needle tip protein [Pandoraea commovens]VVD93242.1 Cell invasion protein SipD [Pandoraea commovens]
MTSITTDRFYPVATLRPEDVVPPEKPENPLNVVPGTMLFDAPSPDNALIDSVVKGTHRFWEAFQFAGQDMGDDAWDDARMAGHDLVARAQGLADSDIPMPQDLRDRLRGIAPQSAVDSKPDAPGIRSLGNEPPPSANSLGNEGIGADNDDDPANWSDAEFWDKLAKLIGELKSNFLDTFQDAAKKYLEFSQALTDIMSKLSSWITSKNDGKEVELDVGKLKEALDKLLEKYKLPSKDAVLWPPQKKDGDGKNDEIEGGSKEDAEKWAKDLGLPDSSVVEQPPGSGKYVVVIDTGPIQTMIDTLPKADDNGKATITTQQLEIWRNGFTGQENQVKTTLQSLSQRYTTANANNENLVKVLSGAIAAMSESAKGFYR